MPRVRYPMCVDSPSTVHMYCEEPEHGGVEGGGGKQSRKETDDG
jgi:hypothetical protein